MTPETQHRRYAWLRLLRLPNVFTAVADVTMGYLVTQRSLEPALHFLLLVVASCLLYLAGMVLNDVFDVDEDARDQPSRPIPSKQISRRSAAIAGYGMLAGAIACAWIVSAIARDLRPGIVALLLAGCVLLYDGVFKRFPVAPIVMGACRMLNVLLGMSLASRSLDAAATAVMWNSVAAWWLASGMGIYVTGVTIFARSDARRSSPLQLSAGLAVLMTGMAVLATTPIVTGNLPPLTVVENGWYVLWILLGLITARRCVGAILQPTSPNVQAAVRHCVHSIIVLNAAACVGYAGPFWGFAVLALLFPTVALTAWIRAT